MIQVLCGESELQEDGVVIDVGHRVRRVGARRDWAHFGTDLDSVPWQFDQYAEAVVGDSVVISGVVVAIAAVYVRAARAPSGGWTTEPGSSWLEPLTTTAGTRLPEPQIEWGPSTAPDADGNAYRGGVHVVHEGDELLSGWLFTLEDEQVTQS